MNEKDPILNLIRQFARLPGIGEKSAARLAFFLLEKRTSLPKDLADALVEVAENIVLCQVCYNPTHKTKDPCPLCSDARRDSGLICVVERPQDLSAIERLGEFQGLYHVLHGSISPLDGRGPEDIKARELLKRVAAGGISEVILAMNPSVEGETTALYIHRILAPLGATVTRLAQGLPVGGHLEFADKLTLSRAFSSRTKMEGGK